MWSGFGFCSRHAPEQEEQRLPALDKNCLASLETDQLTRVDS